MYYFAYGSNMNANRMLGRDVDIYEMLPGILIGYKLTFNKISTVDNQGYATIEKSKNNNVEGVIYQISHQGLKRLDLFEGYPTHYIRKILFFRKP